MASKALGAATGALSGAAAGSKLGVPGAIGGGVLGLLGGLFGGGDDDAITEALQKANDEIRRVGLPPDLSNPITLQYLQQSGLIAPEMIEKIALNADEANTLIENPENRQDQKFALNALKDLSQTGLSPEDRAAANKLRRDVAADSTAKTNQILQQQQMRGMVSSGDTLAAQLASIQGSNQTASEEADRLAANASAARRQALSQFANLAGDVRNQDTSMQKYNLDNELARQKFLDNNSLSRQAANVGARNEAQNINTQRAQRVADTNVNMNNAESLRQVNAKRDFWNDKLKQADMIAKNYTGQASNLAQQAANSASSTQGMITAGLAGAGQLMEKFGGESPKLEGLAKDQTDALNNVKVDNSRPVYATRASGGMVPTPTPIKIDREKFKKDYNSGEDFIGNLKHLKDTLFGESEKRAQGGEVPTNTVSDVWAGQVPVDSEENDKIDAKLSPGEIVIPKSFAHDPDLSKAYINFIHKQKNPKKGK